MFLDGGQHEWTFLQLDQGPCQPRPNIQIRCNPDKNAISRTPPEGRPTGNRETGIGLHTEDIDGYHAELRDGGVDVDPEVSRMGDPVPPLFWLRDPEGNVLMVSESS